MCLSIIYLLLYLSSIYLSVIYQFCICLCIYRLPTYISTTYQLYQFLYLSCIYISIICLLMYLSPIGYVSITMFIIYLLLYLSIYLCLSSIIMYVYIYLCIYRLSAYVSAYMCFKSLQSCLTLCDPMACSLPVSSVHGILQARILE